MSKIRYDWGLRKCKVVIRVSPGDNRKDDCCVGHGPRQWAYSILVLRDRDNYGNAYVRFIDDTVPRSFIPPAREVKPTVGFMPARLLWFVGQVILPSVSVPNVTAASPIDAATADPEEEPHGSAFGK